MNVHSGLLIFRGKKKQNFAGFSGANSRKNREKSKNSLKNRSTSRDFRGRKVKIRRKLAQFRRILAEKSQILKDFQGKFLEKSADFTGNFGGGGKQSVKNSRFRWILFGKFR